MRYNLRRLGSQGFPRYIRLANVPFRLQSCDLHGRGAFSRRSYGRDWYNQPNSREFVQITRGQDHLLYCVDRYLTERQLNDLRRVLIGEGWEIEFCRIREMYKNVETEGMDPMGRPPMLRASVRVWIRVPITERQRELIDAEDRRLKEIARKKREAKKRAEERRKRAQERAEKEAERREREWAKAREIADLKRSAKKSQASINEAIEVLVNAGFSVQGPPR